MAPAAGRPSSGGPADHRVTPTSKQAGWLSALRRYLALVAAANLAWEFAQMPLYTLWRTGTREEIAFAVLHYTAGDVLIAVVLLVAVLVLFGSPGWPAAASCGHGGDGRRRSRVHGPQRAVEPRARGRAYSDLMPVVPWIGVDLAPPAQWHLIPAASLAWACRPWGGAVLHHGSDRQAPG